MELLKKKAKTTLDYCRILYLQGCAICFASKHVTDVKDVNLPHVPSIKVIHLR